MTDPDPKLDDAETPTADTPTHVTDRPNISTEHQDEGDARRPSDKLDSEQDVGGEMIPRKSSLLGND